MDHSSHGLAIDVTYGRVYSQPSGHFVWRLDWAPHSVALSEDDLKRLIGAIEQSKMREWNVRYEGRELYGATGTTSSWIFGILFSDGTIMRRSGWGTLDTGIPPREQYDVIVEFVRDMHRCIRERHSLEIDQANDEQ